MQCRLPALQGRRRQLALKARKPAAMRLGERKKIDIGDLCGGQDFRRIDVAGADRAHIVGPAVVPRRARNLVTICPTIAGEPEN